MDRFVRTALRPSPPIPSALIPSVCSICFSETTQSCSRCKLVAYCCREHQAAHWVEHKKYCKDGLAIAQMAVPLADVSNDIDMYNEVVVGFVCNVFFPNVPLYMKELLIWNFFSREGFGFSLNLTCTMTTWGLLHDCVVERDYEGLELLIRAGADVNLKTNGNGRQPHRIVTRTTPLFQSARLDCLKSAKILLTAGADPNICQLMDQNVLTSCISVEMLDLLERHGADPRNLSYTGAWLCNGQPPPAGRPKTWPLHYSLVANFFPYSSHVVREYRTHGIELSLEKLDAMLDWCETRGMVLPNSNSKDDKYFESVLPLIGDKAKFFAWDLERSVRSKPARAPPQPENPRELRPSVDAADATDVCAKCDATAAKFKCSRCRLAPYCTKLCQQKHWPLHKNLCKAAAEEQKLA